MPLGSFAAISSMARMASPLLFPGAGSPQMFSDGKALYRSSRGEAEVQRPEATEE